ncbi:hypothetical protein WDJ51_04520 [Rathayibacter sp. YIM 133350]|uniref:hypothetical protein n=1 Tax=Rathayibacter sp. YIM 133350 TaxID=3131992 RepID=UPI00307E5CD8
MTDSETPNWAHESTGSTSQQGDSGTAQTAKEQAGRVKDEAVQAGSRVAGTAKDEAAGVAHEVKSQAADLFAEARTQLKDQASTQQKRVADGLRTVGDDLGSMANNSDSNGLAADLVRRVSTRAGDVASWIGDREPAELLDEVRAFARRRPGTFIAIAAIAGVAAGRLTRSLTGGGPDSSKSGTTPSTTVPSTLATDYSTPTYSTGTEYTGTDYATTGATGAYAGAAGAETPVYSSLADDQGDADLAVADVDYTGAEPGSGQGDEFDGLLTGERTDEAEGTQRWGQSS